MTSPQDPFAVPDPGQPVPQPAAPQPAPPPYGTAPYGQQPYGTPGGAPRNGLGTAALVLGILAVLGSITVIGGILLGILAIVLGAIGRGRAKRGEATNGGSATAGLVLGVVGVLLSGALIAFGVSVLNSDSGQQLQDCLESAGSNQDEVRKCQLEFQDSITG